MKDERAMTSDLIKRKCDTLTEAVNAVRKKSESSSRS